MISLGLGKEAWSWYSNIVGIQHLAVEVQLSVDVFLANSAASVPSISNI